ncbi:MAG: translation elongation factor Ts [Candidatus Theseobacter exili]|nr:translation elongation factor Ts [Candidatus Theseobacter exili]
MTAIKAEMVRDLRAKTNAGIMNCKEALKESDGDLAKAEDWLRKKGLMIAAKKATRSAKEGLISSYIHHNGKIGVMTEICCETDFVARNESFKSFVKDVNMHIAMASPQYISNDEVPQDFLEREKEIYVAQVKNKPPQVVEKIVTGKLKKKLAEICLLDQPFVKDTDVTIGDRLKSKIAELGENILIKRFIRFQLGEEA